MRFGGSLLWPCRRAVSATPSSDGFGARDLCFKISKKVLSGTDRWSLSHVFFCSPRWSLFAHFVNPRHGVSQREEEHACLLLGRRHDPPWAAASDKTFLKYPELCCVHVWASPIPLLPSDPNGGFSAKSLAGPRRHHAAHP